MVHVPTMSEIEERFGAPPLRADLAREALWAYETADERTPLADRLVVALVVEMGRWAKARGDAVNYALRVEDLEAGGWQVPALTPDQRDQVARLLTEKHPYIDIRSYGGGGQFDDEEWLDLVQDFAWAIDQVAGNRRPIEGEPGTDGTPAWAYDEDGYCVCCYEPVSYLTDDGWEDVPGLACCMDCGAAVADRERHDAWHAQSTSAELPAGPS